MATNLVEVKNLTAVQWDQAGGANPQLTLANLAAGSASARQGAKANLGTPRAAQYLVRLTVAFAVAPTAGKSIQIYFGFSSSSTAGTDNPMGMSGTDAAYTGLNTDVAQCVRNLQYGGSLSASNTTSVQEADIGVITRWQQYIMPVVYMNDTDQALGAGTTYTLELIPLVDEIEAAA